jgi:hypothetical protein
MVQKLDKKALALRLFGKDSDDPKVKDLDDTKVEAIVDES